MCGDFSDKLYLNNYLFPYFPGDGPYIGYQSIKIRLLPGYQAKVCKQRSGVAPDCETYSEGEHEYRAFAEVSVEISKIHRDKEVELWYGRVPSIVRGFQSGAAIRNPNNDAYLNPNLLWIPADFWVQMCKAEASDGKVSECEIFTAGNYQKYSQASSPYKFIQIGKGELPSPSRLSPLITDPNIKKSKKITNLPKTPIKIKQVLKMVISIFMKAKEINLNLRIEKRQAWQRTASAVRLQKAFVNPSKPFIFRISDKLITVELVRHYRNSLASSLRLKKRLKIYPAEFAGVVSLILQQSNG